MHAKLGLAQRGVALVMAALVNVCCATPAPKPNGYYNHTPATHMGLSVNLDLLAAAKLPRDTKRTGEELLAFFHQCEVGMEDYIAALEKNLEANEQLSKKYGIVDTIVGGLAGLSSPAVFLATAAIAIPIAGAVWVAGGLAIQKFAIEPEIKEARQRLEEARAVAQLFPDIERAFDAAVFVDSEAEAERRFRKWEAYIDTLKMKVSHIFVAVSDERRQLAKRDHTIETQPSEAPDGVGNGASREY